MFNGKINNNLKNFLKILVEKGRISSLQSIELTFKELLNEKHSIEIRVLNEDKPVEAYIMGFLVS